MTPGIFADSFFLYKLKPSIVKDNNSESITVQKSISMFNENTVKIEFRDDFTFDLEAIKRSYIETEKFTGGRKFKRFVICGKNTDITKEARKYGQEENKRLKDTVIAEALVVNSLTQKMITNFYLKFIADTYPCRSFTDLNEAIEWLEQY